MEDYIRITQLNDFIFCPMSIYFHNLYEDHERLTYQRTDQIKGTNAHESVDGKTYTTSSQVLMGLEVYCEEYRLAGKIDTFFVQEGILRERKKKIKSIYDGYVFQLYGQYFAMKEMGYKVNRLQLYSMDDNKVYPIPRPQEDPVMFEKFCTLLRDFQEFSMDAFVQTNGEKCRHCIYEPACDRAVVGGNDAGCK